MKTTIKIICTSCGNEGLTEKGEDMPLNTHHIEGNYCPKCEKDHQGDFFEERFLDENGKEILD